MSGSYRESTNAGKAARRGITEQRESQPAKRKAGSRPVVIEVHWHHIALSQGWNKWRSYRDMETARQALATLSRKSEYAEYRIQRAGDAVA